MITWAAQIWRQNCAPQPAHILKITSKLLHHRIVTRELLTPELNRQTFRQINTTDIKRFVCPTTNAFKASDFPSGDKIKIAKQISTKDSIERKATVNTGGKHGDSNQSNPKLKLSLGVLAALGVGGLVTYYLTRPDKKIGSAVDGPSSKSQQSGIATVPASSSMIPKRVPYLIIGSGAAGFSAFRSIKTNDMRAKVLMITNQNHYPYMRPPLSKELWYFIDKEEPNKDYIFKNWSGGERSIYFEPAEFFVPVEELESTANGGLAVAQGFEVKQIDPINRIAKLADGYEIQYDECLIATGCTPKNLPVFENASPRVREKVMVYRTPEDFDRLRRYALNDHTITIVGNGFTGSELASSLAYYGAKEKGLKIYQIFQESGLMSKVLPNYLSRWTTSKMKESGVSIIPNVAIKSAKLDGTQLELKLSNEKSLLTDIVVVCVGCEPNTQLATKSNLEVDGTLGGFVVNAELEARRNLYVAGDASCFYDPLLGRRRVEHHDHAVVSGRLAGENMTGKRKPYTHQSMFWSDLGPEAGFEAIGLIDSSLPTVGVFALPSKTHSTADSQTYNENNEQSIEVHKGNVKDRYSKPSEDEDYGKGVIFYLRHDKIVGILLWNVFNKIGVARAVINQDKIYDDLNEVAKLFDITA